MPNLVRQFSVEPVWCGDPGTRRSRFGGFSRSLTLPNRSGGNDVEAQAFRQFSNLPLFNGPTMVAVKKRLANYGAGMFYVGPEDIGWEK